MGTDGARNSHHDGIRFWGAGQFRPELAIDATKVSPQEAALMVIRYLEEHGHLLKLGV
jgi:hypothetical protein